MVSLREASGVGHAVLDVMLRPGMLQSYGANRNVGLLACAGHQVLFFDDDTICALRCLPKLECTSNKLIALAHLEPWSVTAFSNRREMYAHLHADTGCLLDMHEQYLGKLLWELDAEGKLDMTDACEHIRQRVYQRNGKVCVTSSGIYGDSGFKHLSILTTGGPSGSGRIFTSNDALLRNPAASRHCIRQAVAPIVHHTGSLLSTAFALDNTGPIAPFFPIGRGEDYLFALLLSAFNGCIVDLPHCLHHARDHSLPINNDFCTIALSDVVGAFFNHLIAVAQSDNSSDNLILSAHDIFADICHADAALIEQVCLQAFRSHKMKQINLLLSIIDTYPQRYTSIIELLDRQTLLCAEYAQLSLDHIEALVLPANSPRLVELLRSYCIATVQWALIHSSARIVHL